MASLIGDLPFPLEVLYYKMYSKNYECVIMKVTKDALISA